MAGNGNGNGAKPKGSRRDQNGRFIKGSKKPAGSGRQRGTKNKVTKDIVETFDKVFDKLGGIDGFAKWAGKTDHNRGIFYRMYARRLPNQIDAKLGGDFIVNVISAVPRPKYPKKKTSPKSGEKG